MLADENIFMFLLFYFNAGRTILRVKQASSVSRRPFPCQASGNSDGKPDLEFVSLFFDCFCLADENIFMFLLFYFYRRADTSPCQAGLFRVKQAFSVSRRPFPCQASGNWDGQPNLEFVSIWFDCFCSLMKTNLCFCFFFFNAGRTILRVRQASSVSSKLFPCQGGLFRVKQAEIGTVSLISNS